MREKKQTNRQTNKDSLYLEDWGLLILNTENAVITLGAGSILLGQLLGEVVVGEVPQQLGPRHLHHLRLLLAQQRFMLLGLEGLTLPLLAFEASASLSNVFIRFGFDYHDFNWLNICRFGLSRLLCANKLLL